MNKISVFVIDDHKVILSGLKMVIEYSEDLEFFGMASELEEAINKLEILDPIPDVILCDYHLGSSTGLDVLTELRRKNIQSKFIILSMIMEGKVIQSCWNAGCHGYLGKEMTASDMINAIKKVSEGSRYIGVQQARLLKSAEGEISLNDVLSSRELEVYQMVLDGKSSLEISEELKVSKRTIDSHRRSILSKTNAKNIWLVQNK